MGLSFLKDYFLVVSLIYKLVILKAAAHINKSSLGGSLSNSREDRATETKKLENHHLQTTHIWNPEVGKELLNL